MKLLRMEINLSKPMNFKEFATLINLISEKYSPGTNFDPESRRTVKYIDPVFDMRSNTVFSITFRGFGWEKNLYCQNECRNLPESLLHRCLAFLDTPNE
jgi:hypothetical protein